MQLRGNLRNAAKNLGNELGGISDFEAISSVIEAGMSAYRGENRQMLELTKAFLGTPGVAVGTANGPVNIDFSNLFKQALLHRDAPLVFAIAQEVVAGGQELGQKIAVGGVAARNPVVAAAGVGMFEGSFVAGRFAGLFGTGATYLQYREGLNGVTEWDVAVSATTTFAAIVPQWSSASSTANLVYTIVRR
jgi:hypothetical protein